ncbi:DUF1989 domain-containing protein [Streptomyces decoyicus]|uniref:DUF1989 domain-containing protein n=1 Tax=Streptomyces decoyicus TaxID=249567 RepID=UPI00363DEA3C
MPCAGGGSRRRAGRQCLVRAVLPYGLTEFDGHDVLNVFQCTGLDADDPLEVCHPIGIEVYEVDDALLEGWASPPRAAYRNLHGMNLPAWKG